jgi:hypothetical protein
VAVEIHIQLRPVVEELAVVVAPGRGPADAGAVPHRPGAVTVVQNGIAVIVRIAEITVEIAVIVGLLGVVDARAVVVQEVVAEAVTVRVAGVTDLADVALAVVVLVLLPRVEVERTVVADVPHAVRLEIAL